MFIRIALLGLPDSRIQTLTHRLSESMKLPLLAIDQDTGADGQSLAVVRQQLETSDSFILAGFPVTVPQAQALDQMLAWQGSPVDLVIMLSYDKGRSVCDSKLETALQENGISRREQLAAAEKQYVRLTRYYKTQNKLLFIRATGDIDADLNQLQAAMETRMRHSQI